MTGAPHDGIVQRDVTVGGALIHYAEAGAGDAPPLVLLHGLGSAGVKFYDALPHFARERRAIAIDLPGFGRSDAPNGPYSPAWQAGAVRGFLDALGIERGVVVGNSYGGLVATWFAAAWPDRCASLVLSAPALPNDGPPGPGAARFVAGTLPLVGPVAQRAYWGRAPAAVVAESVARNCVDPGRVSPEIIRLLEQDAARKRAHARYRRAALAAQRATLWAITGLREKTWRVLSSVEAPTLLLWGDRDGVVPLTVGHAALERLAGAHLIVIDDCGHNPQMEKPEDFAGAVLSFVRATEVADGGHGQATPAPIGGGATPIFTPSHLAHEEVRLAEYDVRWPLEYERERARILAHLGQDMLRIEHIGSTSVPGMAAKPIVDMVATIGSLDDVAMLVERLAQLGYRYDPELERALPNRRFFMRIGDEQTTFHLHVYANGDEAVHAHLVFRDALRANTQLAREYEQLKHHLARTLPRGEYTKAKGPFITGVVDAAGE